MSRIGKMPIETPPAVEVELQRNKIYAKGPYGQLSHELHSGLLLKRENNKLFISVEPRFKKSLSAFWGMHRSLVANMIQGVHQGYSKILEIIGVEYRANIEGQRLTLYLGGSHPFYYTVPSEITVTVEKNTIITLVGADKALLGRVAAEIRSLRKPGPYHNKGIRYQDEKVVLKPGKTAGAK